jgi:hypothetical protein
MSNDQTGGLMRPEGCHEFIEKLRRLYQLDAGQKGESSRAESGDVNGIENRK